MRTKINPQQTYTIDAYGLIDNIEAQMLMELIHTKNINSYSNDVYINYSSNRQKIFNIIRKHDFQYIESIQDKSILISSSPTSPLSAVIKLGIKEKHGHVIFEDEDVDNSKNMLIKTISAYYKEEQSQQVGALLREINELSTNEKNITVKWVVDSQGRDFEITTPYFQKISDSLYPFICEGVKSYVNKFLNSDQSIIILIGEPGMGKSSLIRYMLAEMNKKAYVTFDESVISNDYVFGEFVNSKSAGAFVIEDADTMLKSRQDNNKLMAKFLNVGDGLISLGQKKLIFTTNLPSTKDIDPALMRKGRCFDVLNFRKLTLVEANVVCQEYNLPAITKGESFTLAEIFNQSEPDTEEVVESKFGFLS